MTQRQFDTIIIIHLACCCCCCCCCCYRVNPGKTETRPRIVLSGNLSALFNVQRFLHWQRQHTHTRCASLSSAVLSSSHRSRPEANEFNNNKIMYFSCNMSSKVLLPTVYCRDRRVPCPGTHTLTTTELSIQPGSEFAH